MFPFRRKARDPFYDNPARLNELLQSGSTFHLVDVRTADEYREGHIRGSVHIPYAEIDERPPTDDRSELIVVYCHSGGRSETARRKLVAMGYEQVYNFGGILHWNGELVREDA